jgi:hypothetical protein
MTQAHAFKAELCLRVQAAAKRSAYELGVEHEPGGGREVGPPMRGIRSRRNANQPHRTGWINASSRDWARLDAFSIGCLVMDECRKLPPPPRTSSFVYPAARAE